MDMPTALHPQRLTATHRGGGTLEREHGHAVNIRISIKCCFKSLTFVATLLVPKPLRRVPGGSWLFPVQRLLIEP